MKLLIRNARVVMAIPSWDSAPLRGKAMTDWPVIDRGDVLCESGRIARVGPGLTAPAGTPEIDAAGRVVMPGLVDCHTHACWAGDRLDEWGLKRSGVPYLEILQRGGGIMSTVRAVRAATREQLTSSLAERLRRMLALGSTTIEVKSGYGLSTEAELKMLGAIGDAATGFAGTVAPTALIGHAIDSDAPSAAAFVERTIRETLPEVSKRFPGIVIDAYCEKGAWSLEDCRGLFESAHALGHPARIHADQFNSLGIIPLNSEWSRAGRGFRTIDHLEASSAESLAALAATHTIGVLLPCSGFHTDQRYANGRLLIDSGGSVAIASNANPGSAPCLSVQMAMALAVRFNKLSPAEAIAAATINAAAAAGFADRGAVTPGLRADLLVLRTRDERELSHEFGGNLVEHIILAGMPVENLS